MELYQKVKDKLDELSITFEIVEHAPALTTEQADAFIEGIEGVRTKTMFLTNKKKTAFFLLIMDDKKRLDMELFGELAETKRIKMASADSLFEKMQLPPGVVSPFGLLNCNDPAVKVYIDKAIIDEERMSFHPNTNEKTIFIHTPDLIKFLQAIDYNPVIIEL